MNSDNLVKIVKMSITYLSDMPVNPVTINRFLDDVSNMIGDNAEDRKEAYLAVEAAHMVNLGGDAPSLDDQDDHIEWLNPSTNQGTKRRIDWKFWEHYRQYLIQRKNWPTGVVSGLDSLSSSILSKIEDPLRDGPWDRRGMVMGSVQSGKTANYTAVITKAADAGYKFIVILAGVHNSLRSQTQYRINEEFLGYEIDQNQSIAIQQSNRIGVRSMFSDHPDAYTLTNSSPTSGDFSKKFANQQGSYPSQEGPPFILVVKKNVSILRNLISWAKNILGERDGSGRKLIRKVPLLVIDDECDYASVNTKKPERDEHGNINEEWDPTKTNKLIRELLYSFDKSSYIGYTATPYANIFIYHENFHKNYGEDLFPRNFIVSLPQSTNYIGPDKVFGIAPDLSKDPDECEPLPVVRLVDDSTTLIPGSHTNKLTVSRLPESLKSAINSFILVCAARRIRCSGIHHNSMLIHVTRYVDVQKAVWELVRQHLVEMTAAIQSETADLSGLKQLWDDDFLPSTKEFIARGYRDAKEHFWDDIRRHLFDAANSIVVREINGTSGDVLNYRTADFEYRNKLSRNVEVPWPERGINVIAIGGDKLSRGLTLDGLSISYYLRASHMYDTLMQMGRWFGYREGYNDLCRIYTTEELAEWYSHIAVANAELRNELDYMAATERTPKDFGLKVRSHPGKLLVTSTTKSRDAVKISLSYNGNISETVVFDPRYSSRNIDSLKSLVDLIKRNRSSVFNEDSKQKYHWKNVPAELITNFLRTYRTQEAAKKVVDPSRLAEYIEKQNEKDELTTWHVVIISNSEPYQVVKIDGIGDVGCVKRKPLSVDSSKISIRRLVSPADEALDMTHEELEKAWEACKRERGSGRLPTGPAIRQARDKKRGLLLIYLPAHTGDLNYGDIDNLIIGFAISFPESDTAEPIDYWANTIHPEEGDDE